MIASVQILISNTNTRNRGHYKKMSGRRIEAGNISDEPGRSWTESKKDLKKQYNRAQEPIEKAPNDQS